MTRIRTRRWRRYRAHQNGVPPLLALQRRVTVTLSNSHQTHHLQDFGIVADPAESVTPDRTRLNGKELGMFTNTPAGAALPAFR
jgi:hypothetical protein